MELFETICTKLTNKLDIPKHFSLGNGLLLDLLWSEAITLLKRCIVYESFSALSFYTHIHVRTCTCRLVLNLFSVIIMAERRLG